MTTLVHSGIASWTPQYVEASGLARAIGIVGKGWTARSQRSAPLRPSDTFTVRLVSFELSGSPTDEALRDRDLFLAWERFFALAPTPRVVARANLIAGAIQLPPLEWDF